MKSLDRKLLRDLWRFRASAFGICIVLAVATWTFVLANGAYHSLDATREAYYKRNNFADVFVNFTRAPRSILDDVRAIDGVGTVEGSIRQYATLDMPNQAIPVRALFNALGDRGFNRLNKLTLRSGRMPRAGYASEVVVDQNFASANDLGPGDTVDSIIYGRKFRLDIVGIGSSPEFIFTLGPGDFLPDEERFGVFWMNAKALESATDRIGAINAISVALSKGAPEADVLRKIDSLTEKYGGTGAYGRKYHLSHAFLSNELKQLESLTAVIPPVFLFVAAFLVYVVLGRLVRTERVQIGLLKALGYSDWSIGLHYLKFAMLISVVGTAIGAVVGFVVGRHVTSLYAQLYSFPFLEYRLPIAVFLQSLLLASLSAALGAISGVRLAIRLEPARAMAPPPPPVYEAGPAENLGRRLRLSPVGYMILRHLLRWPMRSAMTSIGVALSIGLTFATLQFVDSARTMIASSFAREQRQDITIMFNEPNNQNAVQEVANIPGVLLAEPSRRSLVKLRHGFREERTIIDGLLADGQLSVRVHRNLGIVPLPPRGLMISQHTANKLDVRLGDQLEVELMGGNRTKTRMEIAAIVDEFVASRVYASAETMQIITRDDTPADSVLARIDQGQRETIYKKLKGMPRVMGVVEKNASIQKFEELIDQNIMTLIRVFVVFASAVSAGVVYNSARIIHAERAQEFAILRVLGYERRQVAMILIGELATLVAIAVPLGCVIGTYLGRFMTSMISSDLFRLPFAPTRSTYGSAVVICLIATMLSIALVVRLFYTKDPGLEIRQDQTS
jgi:putative ABC transport system permease protein